MRYRLRTLLIVLAVGVALGSLLMEKAPERANTLTPPGTAEAVAKAARQRRLLAGERHALLMKLRHSGGTALAK
jgi:hypothetical protein